MGRLGGVRLSRRALIVAASVVLGAGTLSAVLPRPLGTTLDHLSAARDIGARHANQFSSRFEDVWAALWNGAPPSSEDQWGESLMQLRHADFQDGRLVKVDGWWLARTELLLCVALHLATEAA